MSVALALYKKKDNVPSFQHILVDLLSKSVKMCLYMLAYLM